MAGIPDEQYLVYAKGKRKGVLLSIERYEQILRNSIPYPKKYGRENLEAERGRFLIFARQ